MKRTAKFKFTWNRFWKILTVLGVLFGIFSNIDSIKEYFESPKERYNYKNYQEGDLKSPKISSEFKLSEIPPNFTMNAISESLPKIKGIYIKDFKKATAMIVQLGNYALVQPFPQNLYEGLYILSTIFSDCSNSKLLLAIRDDRLYVSVEVKDLQKEETIAFIEYNHWKVFLSNQFEFYNDDKRLEIKDKQHNVALSITYFPLDRGVSKKDIMIVINGYFISPKSVLVLKTNDVGDSYQQTNKCFIKTEPNWKANAETEISTINSIVSLGKFKLH